MYLDPLGVIADKILDALNSDDQYGFEEIGERHDFPNYKDPSVMRNIDISKELEMLGIDPNEFEKEKPC